MLKVTCGHCGNQIPMHKSRYKTADKQYLCKTCLQATPVAPDKARKYTLQEIVQMEGQSPTEKKAEKKEVKEAFKAMTANKPYIYCLIKQDSSKTFKSTALSLSHDYIWQHEAGRVIINNQKEYILKSYSWTPNIVGKKEFSVGKALTGAALVGELGLIAGAKGKKGEDKSFGTLLLQDVETGDKVKMTADITVDMAQVLGNFITDTELNS